MQSISAANGREAVRQKIKRRFIIVGIFVVVVVVVVVVLEAIGWIRTCYAHPVLERFLQKCNFDDRPTLTRPDEVDFASPS
jgi:hypothetical protein